MHTARGYELRAAPSFFKKGRRQMHTTRGYELRALRDTAYEAAPGCTPHAGMS